MGLGGRADNDTERTQVCDTFMTKSRKAASQTSETPSPFWLSLLLPLLFRPVWRTCSAARTGLFFLQTGSFIGGAFAQRYALALRK